MHEFETFETGKFVSRLLGKGDWNSFIERVQVLPFCTDLLPMPTESSIVRPVSCAATSAFSKHSSEMPCTIQQRRDWTSPSQQHMSIVVRFQRNAASEAHDSHS